MTVAASMWKLALAVGLAGAIIVSVSARAPRKPLAPTELRWPVVGALALYAVALVALLTRRAELAALLFAAAVATSALAAWLSRGGDSGGEPPEREDPGDEPPPPVPDGSPSFDWGLFERQLSDYVDRSSELIGRR